VKKHGVTVEYRDPVEAILHLSRTEREHLRARYRAAFECRFVLKGRRGGAYSLRYGYSAPVNGRSPTSSPAPSIDQPCNRLDSARQRP